MTETPQLDGIMDLLDKNEIPQRVTNRAVFRALQAIWIKLKSDTVDQASLMELMSDLENRVSRLEDLQAENPSLFYYIKNNPRNAAFWLIGILFFVTLALSFSDPLRALVSSLIP